MKGAVIVLVSKNVVRKQLQSRKEKIENMVQFENVPISRHSDVTNLPLIEARKRNIKIKELVKDIDNLIQRFN